MNRPIIPGGSGELEVAPGQYRPLFPADGYVPDYDLKAEGLDLAAIWRIFWERRLLILAATSVCLALSIIISLLETPLYRSTAILELNPPTMPILTTGGSDDQSMIVPQMDMSFLATQYGLLRSTSLARNVVEDLNLGAEEVDEGVSEKERLDRLANSLARNVQITPVPSSRLVEITYTSENPSQAARVVNGYAETFIDSTLERRYEAASNAREFLEERLGAVREALDEAERKMVAYAKENEIIETAPSADGTPGTSLQGASLTSLNEALAAAQQRRISAEQRYRNMSGSGTAAEASQSTAGLRAEKAKLEAEYQEKLQTFREDYPDMVRLRTRIDSLTSAIAAESGTVTGSRASTLRAEFQAAAAEEASIQAKVNQLKQSVLNLRERSIQYNILSRELDTNRSLYDALLERYNEIGVAGGIDSPLASLVDRGQVPASPYTPNVLFNIAIGLLLGLGAGAGLALAHYYFTDRIMTPDDVREKLHMPLLAAIPAKQRGEELAEVITDRRSPISESYATLGTTLQFSTAEGMPKTLLVTSTVAGEGKSTTSFVLARTLAQHGYRVLLIDADLRKPSFVVDDAGQAGFSQLVIDGRDFQDHVFKTSEDNLWLMPSGPIPPNPVQVLNSDKARGIIAQARESFDVVIVDAPPSYGFADAPLLASMCDTVALVVESGKARRRLVLESIHRLRASGAHIAGVALTKYRFSTSDYGYSYYHAYNSEGRLEPHELAVGLIDRKKA